MAVTIKAYGQFPLAAMQALISDLNSASSDIKCCLMTSAYTPDQDTHVSYNDITNEITGTGYTAGGASLSNKTLSYSTRTVTFDADTIEWAASTLTARYFALYDNTPSGNTNKKLIAYGDFGADRSTIATSFQIIWPAQGILAFSMA
jgi:hypothetical protein